MKILKFLTYVVVFFGLMILFLPKENFYYFAEHKLSKYNIFINNEILNDNGWTLSMNNASVSFGIQDMAKIEEILVSPFVVYNEVKVTKVHVAQNMKGFIPEEIDTISLKAALFFPIKIWINIEGNFGKVYGNYNIYTKQIYLILEPIGDLAQKYPLIYSNFKNKEGRLIYEASFK